MKRDLLFDASSRQTIEGIYLDDQYFPLAASASVMQGDSLSISVEADGTWSVATLRNANGDQLPWTPRGTSADEIINAHAELFVRQQQGK